METRIKENPRSKTILSVERYFNRFRAEYLHPKDGKWYPIVDRRYNLSKRKAASRARSYAIATRPAISFTSPRTDKGIHFQQVGDV